MALNNLHVNMIEAIKTVPPFTTLREEDWEEIVHHLITHCYPKDTYIFFQGDPPDALYVIWRGHIALVRHTPEGRDVVLDVVGPGRMVGELAIFEAVPYSASAKTLDEVAVVAIPREDFLRMLERYPRLAYAVIYDLARRVRHLGDLVQSLVIERVEQRLARLLIRLATATGQQHNHYILIPLPLTRQDLADMIGTTVETTIRTLSRMRKEGIVDTTRGHILIRDLERLRDIAEEYE